MSSIPALIALAIHANQEKKGRRMDNKTIAAAMRKVAEKWVDIIPVTKELWLQIADRLEASADPKRSQPYKEVKL